MLYANCYVGRGNLSSATGISIDISVNTIHSFIPFQLIIYALI